MFAVLFTHRFYVAGSKESLFLILKISLPFVRVGLYLHRIDSRWYSLLIHRMAVSDNCSVAINTSSNVV